MGSFDACIVCTLPSTLVGGSREDANEVTGPRLQGMVEYSFPKAQRLEPKA